MTAPIQTTPEIKPGMTKSDFERLLEGDLKGATWVTPFGAPEEYEIPLSVSLIRKYIAVPAKSDQGEYIWPTDEQCNKFIALCKARQLNPFEGDAYMIPFWDKHLNCHNWSLITAHSAFLKRAELHMQYDGMDSGIIIERKGEMIELQGDFRLDSDKLLGGWSIVYKKHHSHPTIRRVRLSTYVKPFGVWVKDPEGMICKVAEAQGLRDSFPTIIGGLFLKEELEAHEDFQRLVNKDVKEPKIQAPIVLPDPAKKPSGKTKEPERSASDRAMDDAKNAPAPPASNPTPPVTTPAAATPPVQQSTPPVTQPTPAQPQAAPTPQPVATPAAPAPASGPAATVEEELLKLCAANNITVEQLNNYCMKDKWIKPPMVRFSEMSPTKLAALMQHFKNDPATFAKRIMSKH
jgi:phage recombination protein Bet